MIGHLLTHGVLLSTRALILGTFLGGAVAICLLPTSLLARLASALPHNRGACPFCRRGRR